LLYVLWAQGFRWSTCTGTWSGEFYVEQIRRQS